MRLNYSRTGCTGLVYDGHDLTDVFQVVSVSIPLLPTFEAVTQELAQRPGSYFASRKVGTREIKVKLRLDAETRDPMGIFREWREVSSLLSKDAPKKLRLDEDRYCYAIAVGETEIVDEAYYGVVEVTFACHDPFFYGQVHEMPFAGEASFHVLGSECAYPMIDLVATSPTVVVTNADTAEYVRIPNLKAGAKVAIDMARQQATVGGEYAPVDLMSDFFPVSGDARVKVTGAKGTIKYQERYL